MRRPKKIHENLARTFTQDKLTGNYLPKKVGERESFIEKLLVRIRFIIVMIRWTGLAPWEFKFPFPGSLTSTFLRFPN